MQDSRETQNPQKKPGPLRIEEMSVSYGDIRVLWGISVLVAAGNIVSLIGSNGAGKTTTLKTIAGVLKPSNGNIFFEGKIIIGS